MLLKLNKVCIIISLFCITLGHTERRFAFLEDLQNILNKPPVVVMNPNGGYFVIWEEIGEIPEIGEPPRSYYYRLINAEGEKVVSKAELGDWQVLAYNTRHFNVKFSTNSIAWLNSDTLLIMGWRQFYHSEQLERVIINEFGRVIKKDTFKINGSISSKSKLLKTKQGKAYFVEIGIGYDWRVRIMQVFPESGEINKVIAKSDILKWFLSDDNAVTITAKDKILICCRLITKTDKPIWEAPEGWAGMPNDIVCFLTDLDGTLVGEPRRIDLTKDAFRKMPGIHLGGNYGHKFENAWQDLDLSNLPNGDIILSVTGLDEKGNLCVYQVKFIAEGIFIQPDSMEVVQPRTFPKDKMLPISKVAPAAIGLGEIPGKNKVLVRRELVLFGFDEEGNFYEEREVWRESEE